MKKEELRNINTELLCEIKEHQLTIKFQREELLKSEKMHEEVTLALQGKINQLEKMGERLSFVVEALIDSAVNKKNKGEQNE